MLAALVPFDGLLAIVPHAHSLRGWKEALVLVVLAGTFVGPARNRAEPGRRLPGWAPAVAGLMLIGLVSSATVSPTQAMAGFRIDFFYVLLAWSIWRCPPSSVERDRLISILLVTGIITAFVGVAEEAIGAARLNAIGFPYNTTIRFAGGHLRAFSSFTYQSPFAYFLMLVLLVVGATCLVEPRRLRSTIFFVSSPLLLLALFFTFERGAWLGLGAGALYLGIRRHRILLIGLPFAGLGLLFLPAKLASTALSSSSLAERSSGWQANLAQVLSHPLGSGIGASGAAASLVAKLQAAGATGASAAVYQPDNYYFKTIYELGIPGLWMLVLFLLSAIAESNRMANPNRADTFAGALAGALAGGVTAFLLAAAVASTVATFFEIFPMDVFTWMLLSIVATTTVPGERPSESPGPHSRPDSERVGAVQE